MGKKESGSQLQVEVKTITPEEAKNLLIKNKKNRPLNDRTVSYYADQMKRGKWKLNGEGLQFGEGGALINGQHRLQAVIKAGVPIDFLIVYNVPDEAFTTFDQQRTRTAGDIFSLEGIKKAAVVSSMATKVVYLDKGIYSNKDGFVRSKLTKEDVLDEYLENRQLYDEISNHAQLFYRKLRLYSISEFGGYMIYLIKTKGHDKEHVLRFFRQLSTIDQPKFDIIMRLRDTLLLPKIKGLRVSAKAKYAYLVKAWNAYHINKDTRILTFDEYKEDLPKFL